MHQYPTVCTNFVLFVNLVIQASNARYTVVKMSVLFFLSGNTSLLSMHMWQSRVEIAPLHNLTALLHWKRCSAKLLLRVGLICAVKMDKSV